MPPPAPTAASADARAKRSPTKRDRNSPIDSDMADNRSEFDGLNDNFVRFWLWVLRNYRNCGADWRVRIDLSLLAHLCLLLPLQQCQFNEFLLVFG